MQHVFVFSAMSVLLTESLLWSAKSAYFSTFLEEAIGGNIQLLPTLFGLKLAEDLDIGTT